MLPWPLPCGMLTGPIARPRGLLETASIKVKSRGRLKISGHGLTESLKLSPPAGSLSCWKKLARLKRPHSISPDDDNHEEPELDCRNCGPGFHTLPADQTRPGTRR